MGTPPDMMDCPCATWAHEGWRAEDLVNHHPTCEHRKHYDGVQEFAKKVVVALQWWGAQEDGIPDEPILSEVLSTAKYMVGQNSEIPTPGGPDA